MIDLESEDKLDDEVKVLLAFSRGTKMRNEILKVLRFRLKNRSQIVKELKSDWWTVQKHLQHLMKAGLIKSVSFRRIKFYYITPKASLFWIKYLKIFKTLFNRGVNK